MKLLEWEEITTYSRTHASTSVIINRDTYRGLLIFESSKQVVASVAPTG